MYGIAGDKSWPRDERDKRFCKVAICKSGLERSLLMSSIIFVDVIFAKLVNQFAFLLRNRQETNTDIMTRVIP